MVIGNKIEYKAQKEYKQTKSRIEYLHEHWIYRPLLKFEYSSKPSSQDMYNT